MNDDESGAESTVAVCRYRAECRDCDFRRVSADFERADDELATHIDDGSPCHEYSITAEYQDGTEQRVA